MTGIGTDLHLSVILIDSGLDLSTAFDFWWPSHLVCEQSLKIGALVFRVQQPERNVSRNVSRQKEANR